MKGLKRLNSPRLWASLSLAYFFISEVGSAHLHRTRRANSKSRSQIISEANQFVDKHLPSLAGNEGNTETDSSDEQDDKKEMESWLKLQKMFEFTEEYPALQEKIMTALEDEDGLDNLLKKESGGPGILSDLVQISGNFLQAVAIAHQPQQVVYTEAYPYQLINITFTESQGAGGSQAGGGTQGVGASQGGGSQATPGAGGAGSQPGGGGSQSCSGGGQGGGTPPSGGGVQGGGSTASGGSGSSPSGGGGSPAGAAGSVGSAGGSQGGGGGCQGGGGNPQSGGGGGGGSPQGLGSGSPAGGGGAATPQGGGGGTPAGGGGAATPQGGGGGSPAGGGGAAPAGGGGGSGTTPAPGRCIQSGRICSYVFTTTPCCSGLPCTPLPAAFLGGLSAFSLGTCPIPPGGATGSLG